MKWGGEGGRGGCCRNRGSAHPGYTLKINKSGTGYRFFLLFRVPLASRLTRQRPLHPQVGRPSTSAAAPAFSSPPPSPATHFLFLFLLLLLLMLLLLPDEIDVESDEVLDEPKTTKANATARLRQR